MGSTFKSLAASFIIISIEAIVCKVPKPLIDPAIGIEEGLVGFWDFEEGQGNFVNDVSGNGSIGTVNDATWSTDTPEQYCSFCSSSDSITVTINPSGCTDSSACNFNAEATCDDGSCEYITPVDLGEDITTCDDSVTLDAGEGYDSYLWSNGETTPQISVNTEGSYSVDVIDVNGCEGTSDATP